MECGGEPAVAAGEPLAAACGGRPGGGGVRSESGCCSHAGRSSGLMSPLL